MPALKIGGVYQLKILDHAMVNGNELGAAVCEVYGKVISMDKYCYYLATWICENMGEHNTEAFAILKKAIVEKRRLM